MSTMNIIFVIMIIIMFLAICYLIYKLNSKEREINCLLSNLKNMKRRQDDYQNENNRLEWNIKIKELSRKKHYLDLQYKPNKPIKVLIGDYSESVAPFTNSILESLGIETVIVPSGKDIVTLIQEQNKFDLIITNNVYKGGDSGVQTLNSLKEIDDFEIPVVILTVDQDKNGHYIKKEGFDGYIQKPLDIETAMKTLTSLIPKLKFKKIKKQ